MARHITQRQRHLISRSKTNSTDTMFGCFIWIIILGALTYLFLRFQNSDGKYESKLHVFPPSIRRNPCNYPDTQTDRNITGGRRCITEAEPSMLTSFGGERLGNKMLNYATLFAIGHYNSRPTFMSPTVSDFISQYFNVSMDTLSQDLFDKVNWTVVEACGILNDSFRKLNVKNAHIELMGLPQGWEIFHEVRPLILNEFQFYDHILGDTRDKLRMIREEFFKTNNTTHTNMTFVGVHVRRTDYGYSPGIEFYNAAMMYFQKKHTDVIFVVASDDTPWCVTNFAGLNNKFRIHILRSSQADPDSPGLDLSVLTHCDHVIYGVGSFGFWAGYLNPGEVIFCSDCIPVGSNYLRNRHIYDGDFANVVLPTWIGYSKNGVRTNRSDLPRTNDLIG